MTGGAALSRRAAPCVTFETHPPSSAVGYGTPIRHASVVTARAAGWAAGGAGVMSPRPGAARLTKEK